MKKRNNLQGQYLQEVGYSFLLKDKIDIKKAKSFIISIAESMDVEILSLIVNEFGNGGFDVACTIRESIIYFAYWIEHNFVRIFCSSCKKFDEHKVANRIKRFFKLKNKVQIEFISDYKIKKIVEDLCLNRY